MPQKPWLTFAQKEIIFYIPRKFFKIPWTEKLLATFIQKRVCIKLLKQFLPLPKSYPKPTFRHCFHQGIRFTYDISDTVDWYNYFNLPQLPLKRLLKFIGKNAVVMDIGANIGTFSLPLAQYCTYGNVHSFEPHEQSFERLKNNIDQNIFTNISIYNVACSSHEGTAPLYETNEHNSGMNRLSKSPDKDDISFATVQLITLDSFVCKNNISVIDAIKIDAEGHEYDILQGAYESLKKFSPLLLIELDDRLLRQQGYSAEKLIKLLQSHGYQYIQNAETREAISTRAILKGCVMDIFCSKKII
ncbi:MAG: FkbM family methyltransferase [Ferruginibacter sp.]